jgi:hypothetical protein
MFQASTNLADLAKLGRGPANAMYLTYFSALDRTAQAFSPFKNVAWVHAEWFGFLNRRAQALLDVPSQLMFCRTPQDVLREQMHFWDTAVKECDETSRRILSAYANSQNAETAPEKIPENLPRARDYITIPTHKIPAGSKVQSDLREREFA